MSIDIEKLETLKKALLNQSQYAKIEVTAMQRDEDENDLFLELFEYACDVDYCYDNYTVEELIEFLKDDDFDSLIDDLGFIPDKNIVDELIEVAGNNPKVKLTFSKYCCSGFYGKNCRCKRCCTEQNKSYNLSYKSSFNPSSSFIKKSLISFKRYVIFFSLIINL